MDYQRSEDVIRLLQFTQQSVEQLYAVLHCTGFIRSLPLHTTLLSCSKQELCCKGKGATDTVIDGERLRELEWEGGGTEGVIGGLRKDLEGGERGREVEKSLVQHMANIGYITPTRRFSVSLNRRVGVV